MSATLLENNIYSYDPWKGYVEDTGLQQKARFQILDDKTRKMSPGSSHI